MSTTELSPIACAVCPPEISAVMLAMPSPPDNAQESWGQSDVPIYARSKRVEELFTIHHHLVNDKYSNVTMIF